MTERTNVLLEDIVKLLILQLITSGVPIKRIARSLGISEKYFNECFRWAKSVK